MNQKLEKQIISVAYGDAALTTKIKIHFLAKRNPDVKKLLDEYSATADKVRSLKKELLYNPVTRQTTPTESKSIIALITSHLLNKPALKYATGIALILIAVILFNTTRKPEYTEAEIKLAEKQIKQTLVFVGETFTKASRNLEKDIIPQKIGKPFSENAEIVKNLFRGENKNEKLN